MYCRRFIVIVTLLLIHLLPGRLNAVTDEDGNASWRPSPAGAALRSLALPGWGQMYARNPLKAVIYAGLEQGFIYGVYRQHKLFQHYDLTYQNYNSKYQNYNSKYQNYFSIYEYYEEIGNDSLANYNEGLANLNKGLANLNKGFADNNERIANSYKNDRNRMMWYLTAALILSMMDAYVEAHLYGFDVSDDLAGSNRRHDSVRSINYALSGFPGGGVVLDIFWRIP